VVHLSEGLRPPTLLLFIVFFQSSIRIEPQEPNPHRTGDLRAPRQALLPRARLQHKASLQSLALSSASSHAHSMHKANSTTFIQLITCTQHNITLSTTSLLDLVSYFLRRLAFYLYITKGVKAWINPWADIPYPLHKP
jgi:hypothetical protein